MKKALFLPFDELFDNLKVGKEIIVLEKSLEKVSNYEQHLPIICQSSSGFVQSLEFLKKS